jgi:hypothetical protein
MACPLLSCVVVALPEPHQSAITEFDDDPTPSFADVHVALVVANKDSLLDRDSLLDPVFDPGFATPNVLES